MSDPFANQVLEAIFGSDLSFDAAYAAPGESEFDIVEGTVSVLLGNDTGEDAVDLGGFQGRPIQKRTIFEIRVSDAGWNSVSPAEGGRFLVANSSKVFPGQTFQIEGVPMRLDRARLVWTCFVSEVAAS